MFSHVFVSVSDFDRSLTVSWEQLSSLKSGAQWTIVTAREYISFQKTDPWEGYWRRKQSLSAALKTLGVAPSRGRK